MRFGEGSYAMWCLYMTGNSALEGDLFALQQQVETGAKVVLGFDMPEEARFRVVMRKGEDELANVNMPPWDRDAGGFRAVFDYDSVRHADNMCVVFADGWLVKDRAGKTYEASCDRMIPAMTTGNEVVWSYDLAAPASPPASASAPVPIDGIVVPEPAFADLRTEADMLIDAASNKRMAEPGDANFAPEELAGLIVGKTVRVGYPSGSVAELRFGEDGSFAFLFDGRARGEARRFTIHPRGWVCLHRDDGPVACEKYVRNGDDVFRLNPVEGRLKVGLAGDQQLATKGDPNPGLELIPGGWNGIYRTAEMKDGKWEAAKYSGEVDSYQTCKLLDDTYIICQ